MAHPDRAADRALGPRRQSRRAGAPACREAQQQVRQAVHCREHAGRRRHPRRQSGGQGAARRANGDVRRFRQYGHQPGALHVPYRGGSAMVNGLLTGEIQVGWSGIPNVIELIASGKLRGYCVSVLQRSPSTPAMPTCDELGQKGFDVATVMGLQAPSGTPPKVIARLQAEVAAAMREPAMVTRMQQLGMVMEENGTASYVAFMKRDMERYAQVIKNLGLQEAK